MVVFKELHPFLICDNTHWTGIPTVLAGLFPESLVTLSHRRVQNRADMRVASDMRRFIQDRSLPRMCQRFFCVSPPYHALPVWHCSCMRCRLAPASFFPSLRSLV